MVDVYTYLNGLQIARLADRYEFEFSDSNKLSKDQISKAASKKASINMDDTAVARLKREFVEDQKMASSLMQV